MLPWDTRWAGRCREPSPTSSWPSGPAARVLTAIVAGVFAGGGVPATPASTQAIPIVAVAIGYRAWPRFRTYLLTLDPRLVLTAQLWRVIGIAFLCLGVRPAARRLCRASRRGRPRHRDCCPRRRALAGQRQPDPWPALRLHRARGGRLLVANATGLSLEPSALTAWPLAIFPTIMIPFFAVLHLVAVLQSRQDWDDRVRHYAIHNWRLGNAAGLIR